MKPVLCALKIGFERLDDNYHHIPLLDRSGLISQKVGNDETTPSRFCYVAEGLELVSSNIVRSSRAITL